MKKELSEYRKHLILAEQKAQEDYDKTVLTLSGGALGISFAFVDQFIGDGPTVRPALLVAAWTAWAASVGLVLVSYYVSGLALRKAIRQTDEREVYTSRPGGWASLLLDVCNCGSGILFLAGVILMVLFVHFNLGV